MKQEEKNRKMLEELQRQKRQMMQKNASSTNRPTNLQTTGPISSGSERDLSTPSGMGPSITPTSLASKVAFLDVYSLHEILNGLNGQNAFHLCSKHIERACSRYGGVALEWFFATVCAHMCF
uniref:Uncharacterized protein n=1 Tax=Meloidogyne incognita TaxID=6306 RepID=A0A914LIQ1_MELIC